MARFIGLLLLSVAFSASSFAADDILIADFESDTYGDWKTTGEAFGPGPARGTLPGQMHVDGFKGKGLASSFHQGDKSTGTLTSPAFKIERKYITFLIGGGKDEDKLAINLLLDGKVVRIATGPNDKPGGSERLAPELWDVAEFAGKMATIQMIDNATGGWGHISIDHIVQTDTRIAVLQKDVKREFKIEKRYLNIPIKNGATKRKVTLIVGGKVIVRNDIELADGKPDWWASMDMNEWAGKTITLQVDKLSEDSQGLRGIQPSDTIRDADTLYREPLRGQFHFSPMRGWNNDPNGLVYFNGEYHLFFQHNPYGWSWGNMHWGHAVSKDLIHWEEHGDVLAPDELGAMFSGSAVVDWNNTSGFGQAGKPPLVLIYTAAGNPTTQCIAYSTDGRKFTKYQGNPVLKQITDGNRDPKVFWHEPTGEWVMALYVGINKIHTVHFFTSLNLREWTKASVAEGGSMDKQRYLYECPDFFELPVGGDKTRKKWVLMGANTEYGIGTFDGAKFKSEISKLPGQRGKGFYAPQTFSDIPAQDGRRIQIGWWQTNTPGMPFNQSMSLPLELKLISTADGPRLTCTPVKELESLRAKSHDIGAIVLKPDSTNPLAGIKAELVEIRTEFEPESATEVQFTVRGAKIVYDTAKQELIVNGHRISAPLRNGKQQLTIYCDRTGIEVFASEGLIYVPMNLTLKADELGLGVEVKSGNVTVTSLKVHELKTIWNSK